MNKFLQLIIGAAALSSAPFVFADVCQTMFIDFGDVNPNNTGAYRGETTEGADVNGNWWNNMKSSGNNYVYPGTTVNLVNSANVPTGYNILLNHRFMTNGSAAAGGLTDPSADFLGELAVNTATMDYLFMEDFQDYNCFTFRGLDKEKSYRFYAFGSRANNQTRIGNYEFRGMNRWDADHQMSGEGCGADGYNGNNNNLAVSDPIFPDENGCITFTIRRVQNMCHINAMKIEERDDEPRPDDAYTLTQTMYVDFGEIPEYRKHGHKTEGADVNGNYWNNIYSTHNDNIPANSEWPLVNSRNEVSGITAKNLDNLKTNGTAAAGGLENPTVENLRDLAIATATEDYFYVENHQATVNIEFIGVDPKKAYRVHAFGCRITNETGDRWAYFSLNGITSWRARQDFSGRCIGGRDSEGKDVHGNIRNVAVSDSIFPDANGKLTFTIERKTGLSHLNVLKLEEFEPKEEPKPVMAVKALAVTGSAVEGGANVAMNPVSPTGMLTGKFAGYLRLIPGTYSFRGLTTGDETVVFGAGNEPGTVEVDGGLFSVASEQVVRLTVDTRAGQVEVLPLESLAVKGSVAQDGVALGYAGNGIWSSNVELTRAGGNEYIGRYIYFAFNGDDALAVKRVAQTDKVVMLSQGYEGENIRLNPGKYDISVDMRQGVFSIEPEEAPYRVSVFGSSVANGQGADNFRGYAYLFGEQLKKRKADGDSSYPFYTSGVSIGGNTTRHLIDRYDDMLRDGGAFVMIGLSLGNEGIHGSANPQGVFNGFRDNMLRLIEDIRRDGKTPVVVNNYTRGDYNDEDYGWVKQMNMLIHEWDVPSVNVLGAIDDGTGKWSAGYIADVAHPNVQGHREFMYAIVPSLFDALVEGKKHPQRDLTKSMAVGNGTTISLNHEGTVHPFTINMRVKGDAAGRLLTFEHGSRKQYRGALTVNADGTITYDSPLKDDFTTSVALVDGQWHDVALTHYHARGYTALYIDGVEAGSVAERLTLGEVVFGDADNKSVSRDFGEIAFWRSGMNAQEIAAHHEGKMMKSSLEIYSPMQQDGVNIPNQAQSLNFMTVKPAQSGVDVVDADGNANSIHVVSGNGSMRVSASCGGSVTVSSADGKLISVVELNPSAPAELSVAPGLYLLAAAGCVPCKVVVR